MVREANSRFGVQSPYSTICFVFVIYCFQIFLFDSDTQYVRSQNVRTVLRSPGLRTAQLLLYLSSPFFFFWKNKIKSISGFGLIL